MFITYDNKYYYYHLQIFLSSSTKISAAISRRHYLHGDTVVTNDSNATSANSATVLPPTTVDDVVGSVRVLATAMTDMVCPFTIINVTIQVAIPTMTASHVIHPVA